MEKSGAAMVMANSILRLVGESALALAMAFTGGVVSVPVFCDSGFVILSPLNRTMAAKSNQSLSVFAIALSMGLYPPMSLCRLHWANCRSRCHWPADLGSVIIWGLIVSIPTILRATCQVLWSKITSTLRPRQREETGGEKQYPSVQCPLRPLCCLWCDRLEVLRRLSSSPWKREHWQGF